MPKAVLWVGGVVVFVSGLLIGSATVPLGAQEGRGGGVRLNHVGLSVANFDETVAFYEKTLGFPVAYRFPSQNGRPGTAFVQISRDTFLEIAPAARPGPATLTHIGIGTGDVAATVARLRKAGASMVTDPRASENSGSRLANVTDPEGIRLELNEQPPDSLMAKAIANWR